MIIAAVVLLNVFHPGKYLNRAINPFEAGEKDLSSDADSFKVGKTGYAF